MTLNKKNIICLVTGAAGFIGAALCERLIKEGFEVIGIDNLNNYYSQDLKNDRLLSLDKIKKNNNWNFFKTSLTDKESLNNIFEKYLPNVVINMAAQAGVRYSLENPSIYLESNIMGFGNILECSRNFEVENVIYASSSSVYGGNKNIPFKENQAVDHPISLYAATKKSNELMAHTYSHLFNIPLTGLRFFTVYGPWGRPDMAPMIFANSIVAKKPINVFNYGNMRRDFTYIDDIVEGIYRCIFKPATIDNDFNNIIPNPSTSFAPHRVFNIGNSKPIELLEFINLLEDALKIKAIKNPMPIQPGDVEETFADTSALEDWIGFRPSTSIEEGIQKFVDWYKGYFLI